MNSRSFFCISSLIAIFLACKGTVVQTDRQYKAPEEILQKSKQDSKTLQLQALMNSMSLEEKVAQLLIVDIRSPQTGKLQKEWSLELEQFAGRYPFGGIILFRRNLASVAQLKELLESLRSNPAFRKIQPFITIDEEGGAVSRLKNLDGLDYNGLSPAYQLAQPKSAAPIDNQKAETLALERGRMIGGLLNSLGLQMNMAPVADLYPDKLRSPLLRKSKSGSLGPIGMRAFSGDPLQAGQMVAAFVAGMQEQGVAAVLKHFPGHGNVEGDPHNGDSLYYGNMETWQKEGQSVPFQAGIEAGAHFVLLGHFQLPEILGDNTPASLSPFVIQNMLRLGLGFDAVVLSDSFAMSAIKDRWNSAQASVRFLQAGGDMPLMPPSPANAVQGILTAVDAGDLSEERIDESLLRILRQKQRMGLLGSSKDSL